MTWLTWRQFRAQAAAVYAAVAGGRVVVLAVTGPHAGATRPSSARTSSTT